MAALRDDFRDGAMLLGYACLSPLGFEHINMLGRYVLTLPEPVACGELRPLRNPSTATDDGEPCLT